MSAAILYNNATSVINTLRADLARLDPSLSNDLTSDAPTTIPAPAAASGASGAIAANVNAQLQTLKKLSDDLSDLAKREITTVKREKALARAAAVKEDLRQLREHYDRWKARDAARVADLQRSQLLGTTGVTQRHTNHADGGGGPLTEKSTILMMDGLLKENEVLTSSGERLDEFINIGRTALQELYEQRSMLKSTQRRMLDAFNSLGMSTTVIRYIEQRTQQDKWILFGGIAVSISLMVLIVIYVR